MTDVNAKVYRWLTKVEENKDTIYQRRGVYLGICVQFHS